MSREKSTGDCARDGVRGARTASAPAARIEADPFSHACLLYQCQVLQPCASHIPPPWSKAVDNVVIDRACRTKLAGEVVGNVEKPFTYWDQCGWHRVTFYGDLREPVQDLARALKFNFLAEA